MIATDKMRIAFAATPLCQHVFTLKDGDGPTKLCAISALVSFAGVQPDLIHKMQKTAGTVPVCVGLAIGYAPAWVVTLALPVLRAEYGIPQSVAVQFPRIFDAQENEWKGVQEVLALCERHNMDELHGEAIVEDMLRFPKLIEGRTYGLMTAAWDYGVYDKLFSVTISPKDATLPKFAKPSGETPTMHATKAKAVKSKFWTASTDVVKQGA